MYKTRHYYVVRKHVFYRRKRVGNNNWLLAKKIKPLFGLYKLSNIGIGCSFY